MSDITWTRRLLALATGRSADDSAAEVGKLAAGFRARSAMLAEAADLSPHEAAERELRRLSAEQASMAERMRAAAETSNLGSGAFPLDRDRWKRAGNHWSRLVELLELLQEARDELRESGHRIAARHPEIGAALTDAAGLLAAHLTRLRALIAQADPHAAA